MYPHLEDEAILDPVEGLQPFEMRLLWEQEDQAVSVTPSFGFFIRTVPEWDVSGSYWAEPLLWPGEHKSGLANGNQGAFLSFLLLGCLRVWPWGNIVRTPSPELRQSLCGGRMVMPNESTRAHLHWTALEGWMANSQAVSKQLDNCLVETKHIGTWAPCNLNLQIGSLHGIHSPSCYLRGYFLDPQESSPTDPTWSSSWYRHTGKPCHQHMLSSETSCHQGLRIAFPPREFLGALGNIWGIPWHECLLLCSWRMAQITKRRVVLCSYEVIPEGKVHTLHFNPHVLTMYTHTAHVAFSLNLSFRDLSSYSFSYSVVLHICLWVFMLLCFV